MADVTITPVSEGTFQVNVRTFEDITVEDIGGLEADLNLKADKASPTFTGTVSGITKSMVGLGSVDNTADISKPVSTPQQNAFDLKANKASPTFTGTVTLPGTTSIGGVTSTELGHLNGLSSNAQSQIDAKAPLANPTFTGTVAGITKSMVGLGSVDNTSDASKPVSTLQQSALDLKINTSLKGAVNGVAELGSDGKVLPSQLPASVGPIEAYPDLASFPVTGDDNVIYIAENTNISYRWNGSGYTEISSSLALGSTSESAHRGDHGASAYIHSQLTSGNPHGVTKTEISLGNVDNTSDVNKPISTATQTALDLKATTSTLNNKVQVIDIDPIYLSGVGDITEQIAEYIDANQLITSTLETSKINIKLGSASPESGSVYSNHSHSNKTVLDGIQEALTTVLKTAYDSVVTWISTNGTAILAHLSNVANPHSVTKTQVGLGSVDNTSDALKPVSTATQTALDLKQNTLVSGTNIKTISGTNILGSGDFDISSVIQDVNFDAAYFEEVVIEVETVPTTVFQPTEVGIKTKYENNANTNAFTDSEKSKLEGIAINVLNEGVVADGVTNNYAIIQSLIVSNNSLFFPRGNYKINSSLTINNITNLKIFGEKGTKITYAGNALLYPEFSIINLENTISNIEINLIEFEVTGIDSVDAGCGIITGDYTLSSSTELNITNLVIENCKFTAPSANINGILIAIWGTAAGFLQTLKLKNNNFENIGRTGFEMINHEWGANFGVTYRDVSVISNLFKNMGTQGDFGGGVSFSGEGEDVLIEDNDFDSLAATSGGSHSIEMTTGRSFIATNNRMKGSTNMNAFHCGSPEVLSHIDSFVISNNVCDLTHADSKGFYISDSSGLIITGNRFNTGSFNELATCDGAILTGNKIITNTYWSLQLRSATIGTLAQNNIFDNSGGLVGANAGTVYFGDSGVTDNIFLNNKIISFPGTHDFIEASSATNNIFSDIGYLKNPLQVSKILSNLITYSEDLTNASWVKTNSTITVSGGTTDMAGTTTLSTVTLNTNFGLLRSDITVIPNTDYTFSFEVKKGTATALKLSVYNLTGAADIIPILEYSQLTNTSTPVRVSIRFKTPDSCVSARVFMVRDSGVTGTVFIGRAMLHEGGELIDYIATP